MLVKSGKVHEVTVGWWLFTLSSTVLVSKVL